jgi:hypothetical protein
MSYMLRRVVVCAVSLTLSACVAGQSIDFKYAPAADVAKVRERQVSVAVDDRRPYVVSGEKAKAYIGHYRAGFGNTWAVTTLGDRPLAEVMQGDLNTLLAAKGFKTASAGKTLAVTVRDWNFDTYINGKFWYEIGVQVKKADGTVAASQVFTDQVIINGNIMTGARFAFEDEMPKVYAKIMRRIVEGDTGIRTALEAD